MNTPSLEQLDLAIKVAFRTQLLAALQRPGITVAEIDQLMKTHQKSLDQEMKAKGLELKERSLALKERQQDMKERQQGEKKAESQANETQAKPVSPVPSRPEWKDMPSGEKAPTSTESVSQKGR